MTPTWQTDDGATLYTGECPDALSVLPDASVDSIVTDPPYGLKFMGKDWDHGVPGIPFWTEALRVAKPGAHLLAFGGTRTHHRLMCAIEDAGWEIRDVIMWVYGSGFPKSLDVSKAIDKVNGETGRLLKFTRWMRTTELTANRINDITKTFMGSHYLTDKSQPAIPTPALWAKLRPFCGPVPAWVDTLVERIEAEREVMGKAQRQGGPPQPMWGENDGREWDITAPSTDAARQWAGWGTALKPSHEEIIIAQKPLTPLAYCAIMITNLTERIESCKQSASGVAECLGHTPAGSSEERADSVLVNAATPRVEDRESKTETGREDDTISRAAISASMSATVSIALNTLLSWRSILAACFDRGKTSTTSTDAETTTDWKILNFCLSQITLADITPDEFCLSGVNADASPAAKYFHAALEKLKSTQELFALAPVIAEEARGFQGVAGKGLRPAYEPIIVARKPLIGTVAANVQEHGTGAINVDATRIEAGDFSPKERGGAAKIMETRPWQARQATDGRPRMMEGNRLGRWPANLILDGSDEVTALFPETLARNGGNTGENAGYRGGWGQVQTTRWRDSGSAARFFYAAKASRAEREAGLEGMEEKSCGMMEDDAYPIKTGSGNLRDTKRRNGHPCVKPLALMRYLCRLVTPPKGVVLDMFAGSGSTGVAAIQEGFRFIGIDQSAEYVEITRKRIEHAIATKPKTKQVSLLQLCDTPT